MKTEFMLKKIITRQPNAIQTRLNMEIKKHQIKKLEYKKRQEEQGNKKDFMAAFRAMPRPKRLRMKNRWKYQ